MIKISLFFSSVCVFFRSLLKKRACATFVEKDTFYGEENPTDKHKHIRAFQNRHNALSVVLSVLLLALFLEDIRCFFNLLAR